MLVAVVALQYPRGSIRAETAGMVFIKNTFQKLNILFGVSLAIQALALAG